MRAILAAGLLACALYGAFGQTAESKMEFEVASVKPYVPPPGGLKPPAGPDSTDPGRLRYVNQSLKDLVMTAYGVKRYQISGPGWLDTQKFEVLAKVPEGATKEQVRGMLRNLLAERFQLVAHREMKDLPVFALLVGKAGPKMKVSSDEPADTPDSLPTGQPGAPIAGKIKMSPDGCPDFPGLRLSSRLIFMNGRGCLTAVQLTIGELAGMLSDRFDRPVVDMTGLTAKYDFTLHFDPSGVVGTMTAPPGDDPLPDVFVAVQQQLGLRLEPQKRMIDLVVIDHAEKTPAEN